MSPWLINAIGGLAGVLGTVCWIPQLSKTLRTRETRDLSLWSTLLLLITIALWLVYGVAVQAWPLVISNIVGCSIVGTLLVMKVRYG